ncbi:MAG: hypothetical protein ACYS15_07585 [Planctomycetota bacterium]|jgi:hypothetical protein
MRGKSICVLVAVGLASSTHGAPMNIATGNSSSVDGYLRVGADEYGSFSSATFAGLGDTYNPAGPDGAGLGPQEAAFCNGFMIFVDTDGDGIADARELLSDTADWQAVACAGGAISTDATLSRSIVVPNTASDTDGDAVDDRLTSSFLVSGPVTTLRVSVIQEVDSVPGNAVALLTQQYTITNLAAAPANFSLVRIGDFDLVWNGTVFGDDSVGTDRAVANNAVFQQEDSTPVTRITMVSPEATDYTGAIRGITPTGGPPDFAYGTDCQEWDVYGLPATWADEIASLGQKINGESGAQPAGCTLPDCDGHVDLNIPVSLAPAGGSTTITVRLLYGGTCVWDCEFLPDGLVGVTDFLALLAQWGGPGSCDLDGGGVSITDFLLIIGNWGPCP